MPEGGQRSGSYWHRDSGRHLAQDDRGTQLGTITAPLAPCYITRLLMVQSDMATHSQVKFGLAGVLVLVEHLHRVKAGDQPASSDPVFS